jgi:hypothetical protein
MRRCALTLLLFVLSLSAFSQPSTGWKNFTATGHDYNQWTNPSYALISDDNRATVLYSAMPATQDFYNPDFGIPLTNVTAMGIEVSAEILNNDFLPYLFRLSFEISIDGGATYTQSGHYVDADAEFVDHIKTAGGPTDLWGLSSIAPSGFLNSNFRIRAIITPKEENIGPPWYSEVDHIKIKVYYVTNAPAPSGTGLIIKGRIRPYRINNKQLSFKYQLVKPVAPVDITDPVIIFGETFENVTHINQAQYVKWNLSIGGLDTNYVHVSTATGHGKVMKIDFEYGQPTGTPIANTAIMLDSVYHRIYLQYDLMPEADFDWAEGGKTFGGFVGGEAVDIPYLGDTANTGFNTLKLFNPGGYISWYDYTHNAKNFGYPLTATVQMPSAAHPGTWVLGKDYSWGKDGVNFGGGWYGFPSRIDWNNGLGVYTYAEEGWAGRLIAGTWNRITMMIDLKSGGNHDVEVIWVNGICTYTKSDNRFRTISNFNWGVEGIYIDAFFGGNIPTPKNQSWLVDNIIAYVLPHGNSYYTTTAPAINSTIATLNPVDKLIISPALPVNEKYTERLDTIYSHNHAFHYMPNYITVNKILKVTGATSYSVTLTQFGWNNSGWSGANPYIKLYRYNSGTPTLVKTLQRKLPCARNNSFELRFR